MVSVLMAAAMVGLCLTMLLVTLHLIELVEREEEGRDE